MYTTLITVCRNVVVASTATFSETSSVRSAQDYRGYLNNSPIIADNTQRAVY